MPDWYPWPDDPGDGIFCRDQAHVAAALHDVAVMTWRAEPGLGRRVDVSEGYEDGLLTFRVRYRLTRIPKLEVFYKLFGVLVALRRLRRDHGWTPDVIHAHEYRAGILALFPGPLARAPLVVSEHNSAFPRGLLERRDLRRARLVFRRAAVVAPVSSDLATFLAPMTKHTRVVPVPNTVDPNLFHPGTPRVGEDVVLITVGQLTEVKGQRYLIDALKTLEEGGLDVHLHMVGEGERRDELASQAAALGLTDRVTFHGFLPKAQVAGLMRDSDIFVLPSLWENMPCVLLEALTSGLPVVATRVGGVPEVVASDAGVIVEPGSSAALAGGVSQIARDRGNFDRGSLHEVAAARYGVEPMSRRWAEVYELARASR